MSESSSSNSSSDCCSSDSSENLDGVVERMVEKRDNGSGTGNRGMRGPYAVFSGTRRRQSAQTLATHPYTKPDYGNRIRGNGSHDRHQRQTARRCGVRFRGGFMRVGGSNAVVTLPDTIYVSGMNPKTPVDDILKHFSSVGAFEMDTQNKKPKIWIYKDRDTGTLIGDATIRYELAKSAELAIKQYDGQMFHGSIINVKFATQRDEWRAGVDAQLDGAFGGTNYYGGERQSEGGGDSDRFRGQEDISSDQVPSGTSTGLRVRGCGRGFRGFVRNEGNGENGGRGDDFVGERSGRCDESRLC